MHVGCVTLVAVQINIEDGQIREKYWVTPQKADQHLLLNFLELKIWNLAL
jgi:hypothetical protein